MGGGRSEEETHDGRLRASEPRRRTEHELLVELHRAAADRTTNEIRVLRLEVGGRLHVTAADARAKAGRQAFDLPFDAIYERVRLGLVPASGDRSARVGADLLRYVGVGPGRVTARRLTRRVDHALLPEEQEWALREHASHQLTRDDGQGVDVVDDMHRARFTRGR